MQAETGAQCFKTFYGRNLQMFIISWSVCPWQAVSAWQMLWVRPGAYPRVKHLKGKLRPYLLALG
jgi:hypothetical protein